MIRRTQVSEKGFTLIELLVVISVIGIVAGIVSGYLVTTMEQIALGNARSNIQRETENSLNLVTQDILLSASAEQNNQWPDHYSPGGTANEYGWTSNATTLILATPAQDNSNGSIIFSDPQTYITENNNFIYFLQNGTLYRRTLAAPVANNSAVTTCPAANATLSCPADSDLLDNVKSLTFTYLNGQNQSVSPPNARSIQINIRVAVQEYGHIVSVNYTTNMVFRND